MNEFFENPFETRKDDFLKSPAEVPVHRKVLLEDKEKVAFHLYPYPKSTNCTQN